MQSAGDRARLGTRCVASGSVLLRCSQPGGPVRTDVAGGRAAAALALGVAQVLLRGPDTDCGLWMRAGTPSDRIRFQFCFFLVYSLTSSSPASPGSPAPNASAPASADACAPGSYLQFYEGPPGAPRPLGAPVCGLTIPVPVASTGDFLA